MRVSVFSFSLYSHAHPSTSLSINPTHLLLVLFRACSHGSQALDEADTASPMIRMWEDEAEHLPCRSRLLLMQIADMPIDNGKEGSEEEGGKIVVLVSLA